MLSGSALGRASVNGADSQDSCSLLTVHSFTVNTFVHDGFRIEFFPRGRTDWICGSSVNSSLLTFRLNWFLSAEIFVS